MKTEQLFNLWKENSFSNLRAFLAEENPVDIAEMLENLEHEDSKSLPALYRLLPKSIAAEVFVEFDSDTAERLISALSDKELAETLSEMFYDDTADLAALTRTVKMLTGGGRSVRVQKTSDGTLKCREHFRYGEGGLDIETT